MLKDEKEMCEGVGYKNVACDFGLGRSWCEVARCEAVQRVFASRILSVFVREVATYNRKNEMGK